MTSPKLILASASPRRRDLLARIGVEPARIAPADIDEDPLEHELPKEYARRIGREKALAGASADGFVLAGDTVVAVGRRILPKAEDEATARKCLELLSGRRHRVLSSVALLSPDGTLREKLNETIVKFKRLSGAELSSYLASGEWEGKAGGYAIQGAAEGLIVSIQGSHSSVMGLPLYETRALLKSAGFAIG
ncbi:Maf family protein [Pontixanthobacter aquaemixtae]|uniref:dTTP/UTP pyrophosphatase n=1 Tax=Pontixanthobacter aquaemixtae TaxID=1958940 RepID=A0A844ZMR5_9SPHN|nr:Maf family nucleotide pyrophosphatase [Pontixanthobacter aquaemixtae]MXO89681.1 septum formation protein Maf [Pontixanthobacter aquaemixtae]